MYVCEYFTVGLNRINSQEKRRSETLAKEYDLYIYF
jgi:hypothetical protein